MVNYTSIYIFFSFDVGSHIQDHISKTWFSTEIFLCIISGSVLEKLSSKTFINGLS